MKTIQSRRLLGIIAGVVALSAIVLASRSDTPKNGGAAGPAKAVQQRLMEIQRAAEALDADKVFSFVLENDQGALIQNGKLLLTRGEALESTKRGFQGLEKTAYQIGQEHITMLSPTIALAVAEGSSSATTQGGREFSATFAQSVVLVLTNGEWKVFHAHRSFPSQR